jgi:hypothetical protein
MLQSYYENLLQVNYPPRGSTSTLQTCFAFDSKPPSCCEHWFNVEVLTLGRWNQFNQGLSWIFRIGERYCAMIV